MGSNLHQLLERFLPNLHRRFRLNMISPHCEPPGSTKNQTYNLDNYKTQYNAISSKIPKNGAKMILKFENLSILHNVFYVIYAFNSIYYMT